MRRMMHSVRRLTLGLTNCSEQLMNVDQNNSSFNILLFFILRPFAHQQCWSNDPQILGNPGRYIDTLPMTVRTHSQVSQLDLWRKLMTLFVIPATLILSLQLRERLVFCLWFAYPVCVVAIFMTNDEFSNVFQVIYRALDPAFRIEDPYSPRIQSMCAISFFYIPNDFTWTIHRAVQ